MDEKELIVSTAADALKNELGLLDWQGALDFTMKENNVPARLRGEIDKTIQAMVMGIIIKL